MHQFKISAEKKDYPRLERSITLLNRLLDMSESKGIGKLRSHGAQIRGASIEVNVQNNVPHSEKPKNIAMKPHANDTLWEVREMIARELALPTEGVRMFCSGQELKMEDNSKKFSELKLKKPITLMVISRPIQSKR